MEAQVTYRIGDWVTVTVAGLSRLAVVRDTFVEAHQDWVVLVWMEKPPTSNPANPLAHEEPFHPWPADSECLKLHRRPVAGYNDERVVCAAVWIPVGKQHASAPENVVMGVVFPGYTHWHCLKMVELVFPEGSIPDNIRAGEFSGFLTSHNRYVDRFEAGRIAFAAGQVLRDGLCLTSEALYPTGG